MSEATKITELRIQILQPNPAETYSTGFLAAKTKIDGKQYGFCLEYAREITDEDVVEFLSQAGRELLAYQKRVAG